MPRGRTKKAQKQYGGMKLSHEIKKHLLTMGVSEVNIIQFLVSNAVDVKVVWDTSTYSFIFQLTLPPGLSLLDSFGLPLAESADTLAAFVARAPELGTPISTFCAKISFVYDGVGNLQKEYHSRKKETTTTDKANKEADIQRMLFEQFACRRSTASFVPDVIAHAILSRKQFIDIFGTALSSTAAPTKPGVLGTPKEIFDWIAGWTLSSMKRENVSSASRPISIDVILMEMMDFERTAPGVPRTTEFKMIYSLRSHRHEHEQAALRMAAEIVLVRGKGVMPHDFHEGNGLATANGEQLYLIDWGGLFYLLNAVDFAKVLDDFNRLCASALNTEKEEIQRANTNVKSAKTHDDTKLARFPCLEDLCGFFQIQFDAAHRATNVSRLKAKFKADLTTYQDMTCFKPIPQTVHRALMMVAFVDFMSNRMNFKYPYCQCGGVLSIVYPNQALSRKSSTGIDVSAFDDFRTFLKTFEVDAFPAHTRLQNVVDMITKITQLCPTACAPLSREQLRPTWMQDVQAAEAKRREAEEEAKRREAEAEAKRREAEAKRREAEAKRREAEAEAKRREAEAEALRLAREAEALRLAREAEALRLAREAEALRLKQMQEAEALRLKQAKIFQKQLQAQQAASAASAASAAKAAASAAKAEASRKRLMALSSSSGIAKPPTKSKQSDALAAQQVQSAIATQAEEPQPQEMVAVPTGLLSRFSRISSALNPKSWSLPSWFKKKGGGTRKHNKHNHKLSSTKRRH